VDPSCVTDEKRQALAARAKYVGSPEHKGSPSFAGAPRPRADATICPDEFHDKRELLESWLKSAIGSGRIGPPLEGEWPRYAWHRQGDALFEARLTNRRAGEYKGYALNSRSEWPKGIDGD
jgi:hypothetical protein